MHQLIISCSLSPTSRSAIMAGALRDDMQALGDTVELIDLRKRNLPLCDGSACYGLEDVRALQASISRADAVTIATPIYNYETGGATRNIIALGGQAWNEKVIGLVCAAGGQGSYMSAMPLANSLMLDFRCIIVPRFVYATGASFLGNRITDDKIRNRITQLAAELHRVAKALATASVHDAVNND